MVLEDPPDGRCPDPVAEASEFAVYAAISPGGVVGGHLENESADRGVSGWASGLLGWLGPVLGNASAMPAKQSVRGDEPTVAAWPGECGGYRSEQASIILGEVGSVVLSVQEAELVS